VVATVSEFDQEITNSISHHCIS